MSQNNKVAIKFHGGNWKIPTEWHLDVKSVGEAMNAIEMNTKSLFKELHENDINNIQYCVVINGQNFVSDKPLETIKDIKESELAVGNRDLKTVDIIPVVQGAGSDALGIFTTILGVILIVIGVILIATGIGVALIFAGIGLVAAGVFSLLSKPPTFEDFREIEQGGKTSYLFSGPQNIVGEGGPVPVAYGRLIVGSQVVSAAYVIRDFNVEDTSDYLNDAYGNLTIQPVDPPNTNTWQGNSGPKNPLEENEPCCFIFIQGEGSLTEAVRLYRDSRYGYCGSVADGYRWMASWLVPLMKSNKLVHLFIKYTMTSPLSRYAEWVFGRNKYGWIFWPLKLWAVVWRMCGKLKGRK